MGSSRSTVHANPPESRWTTSFSNPSELNRATYPAAAPIRFLHASNIDSAAGTNSRCSRTALAARSSASLSTRLSRNFSVTASASSRCSPLESWRISQRSPAGRPDPSPMAETVTAAANAWPSGGCSLTCHAGADRVVAMRDSRRPKPGRSSSTTKSTMDLPTRRFFSTRSMADAARLACSIIPAASVRRYPSGANSHSCS